VTGADDGAAIGVYVQVGGVVPLEQAASPTTATRQSAKRIRLIAESLHVQALAPGANLSRIGQPTRNVRIQMVNFGTLELRQRPVMTPRHSGQMNRILTSGRAYGWMLSAE
jgi:hypothetical protein